MLKAIEITKKQLADKNLWGDGLTFTEDGVQRVEGALARLAQGPKGAFGLEHQSPGGAPLRLTSAVNPQAEDATLVERFSLDPDKGVLVLGLGWGYHLEELAARLSPNAPLWVLESRPELAALLLRHRKLDSLFARPGFRLFVGPFNGIPWADDEIAPPQILWRPATLRHFAAEYPISNSQAKTPPLRPEPLKRLLLFQSGYFLDGEIQNAAKSLGLETTVWNFKRGLRASGENFRELLELIGSFKPQLALTVNHLGFDAEGILDDILTRLKLPVASWFVDSPAFILGTNRPGPQVTAFSWDSDYLPTLQRAGFQNVHYLPLATDSTYFRPGNLSQTAERSLAFVGDSLTAATEKYLAKINLPRQAVLAFLQKTDSLASAFLNDSHLLPQNEGLKSLVADFKIEPTEEIWNDLGALVTWRASRLWRQKVLGAFPAELLTIAGDKNWGSILPKVQSVPPLDYYRELAPFYRTSQVNINITSAQMKSGLNQRIFDVPAAGGFLLTDYKEQLTKVLEPGSEVITYSHPEEAADLACWFLARPKAREKVVHAARYRILKEHLYKHRLAELLRKVA